MAETVKVTLIQGGDGQVRRVRIGEQELPVQHAGPTLADGQMAVSMIVVGVEIGVEKAGEPTAGA